MRITMAPFEFLEVIGVFCDYLGVENLCHAFIMPSTKRNSITMEMGSSYRKPNTGRQSGHSSSLSSAKEVTLASNRSAGTPPTVVGTGLEMSNRGWCRNHASRSFGAGWMLSSVGA